MDMESAADALYLYGILPAARASEVTLATLPDGFEPSQGLRLEQFPSLELAALVEPTERLLWTGPLAEQKLQDIQWVGPRAMVHENIVQAAYEHCQCFYPSRLGTIFSDMPALQRRLTAQVDQFRQYFENTCDRGQYTLKGFIDRQQWRQQQTSTEAVDGSDYLRRRAAQRGTKIPLADLRQEGRRLLVALRQVSQAHQIDQGKSRQEQGRQRLFCWHFLVPRQVEERFLSCLEELAPQLSPRLELALVGPLPPYQFRGAPAPSKMPDGRES